MSKLSIIIVAWNVKEFVQACLNSIARLPADLDYDVVVVDNASGDGGPALIAEKYPQVDLILNESNSGFASANNQGIRHTRGEYVLLLNPDTVVEPGAIETMLAFMQQHPEAGGCGPYLLNPDRSLQYSCSPEPTVLRELARLLHFPGARSDGYYEMSTWGESTPRVVDSLLGACLLLRRQALEQIHLMDETFFMYSEEVDLCHRLNKAGWKLYWVPAARIIHYGGQSTSQVAVDMFLHLYRGKIQYFRKHHGKFYAFMYKVILTITSLPRLALGILALGKHGKSAEQYATLAANYWRLLKYLPQM